MTSEQIEYFLSSQVPPTGNIVVTINFKIRNAIRGFFPATNDSEDLKLKNFWRIITEGNLDKWNETKNLNLTRIFNGYEMIKLKL